MDTVVLDVEDAAESAHTIGRMSARKLRYEVLPGAERRRSWTAEQKLAIVRESLAADLTPTEIARKYRISTGQIYTWRRQLLTHESSAISRTAAQFAAVEVTELPAPAGAPLSASPAALPSCARPLPPPRPEGLIEVWLPGGVSLRVDAQVDGRALRRVLVALEGRCSP